MLRTIKPTYLEIAKLSMPNKMMQSSALQSSTGQLLLQSSSTSTARQRSIRGDSGQRFDSSQSSSIQEEYWPEEKPKYSSCSSLLGSRQQLHPLQQRVVGNTITNSSINRGGQRFFSGVSGQSFALQAARTPILANIE